jgi:hypothetical protein
MHLNFCCIFVILISINTVFSANCRLKDQISVVLPKTKLQCFRLLNGTHQTGCQSDKNGNSGTVIEVETVENFMTQMQFFEKNEEKIIALADLELLTPELITSFHDSNVVNGIILYGHANKARFSEDATCPLSEFSIYDQATCQKWNRAALSELGMRFLNWEKPIFYVDDSRELSLLREDCYATFNRNLTNSSGMNKQRCRAKLTMFMHAAGDAEVCLRRQNLFYGFTDTLSMCEPLSSYNVFNLLPPLRTNDASNIFLLSARLDSFSTFSGSVGGDISVLTSVITILSIADAIGKKPVLFENRSKAHNRQLLLSFFNGESLGYIGSGRSAFDMQNDEFPHKFKRYEPNKTGKQIGFDDIKIFFELQQLGFSSQTNEYYLHVDGAIYQKENIFLNEVASNLKEGLANHTIFSAIAKTTPDSQTLPSSYESFLRHNNSIIGAVFSSAKDQYAFNTINSFEDTEITNSPEKRETAVRHLHNVASGLLKAIAGYVHNDKDSSTNFPIDIDYVETLVECFFSRTWNCSYFQKIIPDYRTHFHAYRNLYIGPSGQQSPMWIIVKALLIQALGETHATPNVKSEDQCDTLNPGQSVYHYVWAFNEKQNKSLCYRTTIFTTQARSPSFDNNGVRSELFNYSTWVESVWDPHKLEVYLDGAQSTLFHFIVSTIIAFIAILLTCFDWYQVNPQATPPVIITTTGNPRSKRRARPRVEELSQEPSPGPSTSSQNIRQGVTVTPINKNIVANENPQVKVTVSPVKEDPEPLVLPILNSPVKPDYTENVVATSNDDVTEPTSATKLIRDTEQAKSSSVSPNRRH